jgi:hypothetical protein
MADRLHIEKNLAAPQACQEFSPSHQFNPREQQDDIPLIVAKSRESLVGPRKK